jgi:hypothetical protein
MTTEEILKEQEPYSTDEGVVLYSYKQVKQMLVEMGEQNISDWFKQEVAANEEFRTLVTREVIMALRYCLPMPVGTGYEQFTREYQWNHEVSSTTAQRLVRLITTGDANKQ